MNEAISNVPEPERPRERCLQQGPQCLSLRELLALILGSGPRGIGCLGVASLVLSRPGSLLPFPEKERAFFLSMEVSGQDYLKEIRGLGPSGRARILAAFELGRRYALHRESRLRQARNVQRNLQNIHTRAIERIPSELVSSPKEWLGFVPAYQAGELGSFCLIERGVRTHVNVDPAELFAQVLSLRATAFFLFHNHPSGDLTPSSQDADLTRKVRDLASRFGLTLLGHGIVSPTGERWVIV